MKRVSLLFLVCFNLLSSCAHFNRKPPITEVPPPIVENVASWDGFKQNSGIIDYVDGKGFILSASAAERYYFLGSEYGKKLNPPIEAGQGLIAEDGINYLSPQYMAVFVELSRIHKSVNKGK